MIKWQAEQNKGNLYICLRQKRHTQGAAHIHMRKHFGSKLEKLLLEDRFVGTAECHRISLSVSKKTSFIISALGLVLPPENSAQIEYCVKQGSRKSNTKILQAKLVSKVVNRDSDGEYDWVSLMDITSTEKEKLKEQIFGIRVK